ncbi:hypothetical protein ABHD89_001008 [Salinicoccus halitifaciens]|uniref:Uncharacterized protein n=1 Tax=Salinicoccus halitifaciens TaxID=1073415 RepID=A0ABV2E861_9STAP
MVITETLISVAVLAISAVFGGTVYIINLDEHNKNPYIILMYGFHSTAIFMSGDFPDQLFGQPAVFFEEGGDA